MLYVKLNESGVPCETPITLDMLRRRFSQVLFPARITDEVLAGIGYAFVPAAPAPARVPGHATVPGIPIKDAKGNIIRTYQFVPYTDEGLEKRMGELRAKRDRLLAESDWTQSEDVQARMNALQRQEWCDYRDGLRNMTSDYDDPNMVTYPAMPSDPELTVVDTRSLVSAVKRKIAAKRMDVQNNGMSYVFPDGMAGTVQTRHEVDVINILGQAVGAIAFLTQGDTTGTLPFRDAENVTHDMTPAQMLQMAMQALAFVSDTYARKWAIEQALDDRVNSNATDDEIKAFDINSGWSISV